MEKEFKNMSEYEKLEFIAPVANKLNITPETALELLEKELANAELNALTSNSDESINDLDVILAGIILKHTNITIVSSQFCEIKTHKTTYPEGFSQEDILDYQERRVLGVLSPCEKSWRQEKMEKGIKVVVIGNPITAERILKDNGYKNSQVLNENSLVLKTI